MKTEAPEYATALNGTRYAFREMHAMPVPAGIEPTHFLLGGGLVPAGSFPAMDKDCVTAWTVIPEVVRDNTPMVDVVPVEIQPVKVLDLSMQPLVANGGLTEAEERVLRR